MRPTDSGLSQSGHDELRSTLPSFFSFYFFHVQTCEPVFLAINCIELILAYKSIFLPTHPFLTCYLRLLELDHYEKVDQQKCASERLSSVIQRSISLIQTYEVYYDDVTSCGLCDTRAALQLKSYDSTMTRMHTKLARAILDPAPW